MIISAYIVGGIALLACSAAFVWHRAGKVDEYLEPFDPVAECDIADDDEK